VAAVGDEVAPRPGYALEAAQRADREAAEDLYQELIGEAGQREPLLRWLFHLVEPGAPAGMPSACSRMRDW
jgi:hypothetical protein